MFKKIKELFNKPVTQSNKAFSCSNINQRVLFDFDIKNLKYEDLKKVLYDPEVAQCLSTIEDKIRGLNYSINDGKRLSRNLQFLDSVIKNNIDTLISGSLQAWVLGYWTYEIDYIQISDTIAVNKINGLGFNTVQENKDEQLIFQNELLNPLVYHRVKSKDYNMSAMGDGLAHKLHNIICNKTDAFKLYADVLSSLSVPIKVLGIENNNIDLATQELMLKALKNPRGAALITGKDDKLTSVSHNINNQSFNDFIAYCDSAIQKMLLGQTLTSDSGKNGNYATAKVHKQVSDEKLQSFADFVNTVVNDFIQTILYVNGFNENECVFKLNDFTNLNTDKAERDKVLFDMGVRFNNEYFTKEYGIDSDLFAIENTPKEPQIAAIKAQAIELADKKSIKQIDDFQSVIDDIAESAINDHVDNFHDDLKKELLKANDLEDFLKRAKKLLDANKNNDFDGIRDYLKAAQVYGYCKVEEEAQ